MRRGNGRPRRKVDVSGRVEKVELVSLSVLGFVEHRYRVGFDSDALFPFQIHRV